MSAERFGESSPKTLSPENQENTNWNEILRNSFLFSQGDNQLQQSIFIWLATGPLRDVPLPDDSSFKNGLVTTYAELLTKQSAHPQAKEFLEADEDASTRRGAEESEREAVLSAMQLTRSLDIRKEDAHLEDVVGGLVKRDFLLLNKRARLIQSDSGRDPNASFVIDFGLFKRGTPPWKYNSIPTPFKEMWKDVMESLPNNNQAHAAALKKICAVYIELHPDLPTEDVQKIQDLSATQDKFLAG